MQSDCMIAYHNEDLREVERPALHGTDELSPLIDTEPQHSTVRILRVRLDPQLDRGDVVVSERVFGYEYGEVGSGFRPRPDWCYPADSAIAALATTTLTLHRSWVDHIRVTPPESVALHPKVVVGTIASGNKVVEDLTDEAFAPVLRMWPTLVAVEMEAWGAVEAIQPPSAGCGGPMRRRWQRCTYASSSRRTGRTRPGRLADLRPSLNPGLDD